MSLIASNNGGINIPKLEGGVYTAISSAIIDLGIQTSEKFGNTQRKFMMIWNILGEEIEVNGEKLPRTMSKEYSFSLSEKSTLRKDLQAWRGKMFTDEELQGFNLLNILNKPCQLQIILEEKNGKQYNNIVSIMSLPKGTTVENLKNTYHFDIEDESTYMNWCNIPGWIQEKIKKSNNYVESNLEKFVLEYENNVKEVNVNNELNTNDDLPF
ncbi:MAG: phage replication initiation protein, NGO0469 family [Clostridia bacterium]